MSFLSDLAKMAVKGAKSVKGCIDDRSAEIYEELKHYNPEWLERLANDESKDSMKRIVALRMLKGWKPKGKSESENEEW